jgi:glutaredoxin-like YruB-family protein
MDQVILYTQPDCPPCEITKKYFHDKGVQFIEKNIKKDKNALNELMKQYNSYSTPTVIIGEKVFTGFKINEIDLELFGK